MRTFNNYLHGSSLPARIDETARSLAVCRVDPHVFLEWHFDLPSGVLVNEGFFGTLFERLGAAWKALFTPKGPEQGEQTPAQLLATAKQAVGSLADYLQKHQGADATNIQVSLRGVQQAASLLAHAEPSIKGSEDRLMQFAQAKKSGNATDLAPNQEHELPPELEKMHDELYREGEQIAALPDGEEKVAKMQEHNHRYQQFIVELEQKYQDISPSDATQKRYRDQLGNWLRRLDTDEVYRTVQRLLTFARRTENNKLVQRPDGHRDATAAWKGAATGTPEEHKQRMIDWYKGKPDYHPVKQFVKRELTDGQHETGDEHELFYDYASYWAGQHPHHLSR